MEKICLLNLVLGLSQTSGNLEDSVLAAKLICSPAADLLHNTIEFMHFLLPWPVYLVVMPKSYCFLVDLINGPKCWETEIVWLLAALLQSYLSIKD